MNADATIYCATLERGYILHFNPGKKRLVFIYLLLENFLSMVRGLDREIKKKIKEAKKRQLYDPSAI